MSVLDKVRRWIDGETAELVLEEAARDAQVKPRSQAEEFIVKIAREVEAVMQREILPLPQGTTIIPTEYAIFLSEEDDKDWQGVKRRGLEQGLYHILAERAKEIAGKRKLETKSFVIELRVDGTLEKGTLRIQHSWEDTSSAGKTGVLARPKSAKLPPAPPQPAPEVRPPAKATNPNYPRRAIEAGYQPPPPTAPNFTEGRASQPLPGIEQAVPLDAPDEGEMMTSVAKRAAPVELYRLEIWLNGVRQNVVPIFNKETSVGRGSRSKPVDITLSGDPEISRRHLTLGTDGQGYFWAMNEGRNPAAINNFELPPGQRVTINPGVNLTVGSYVLRIQPRAG
ncbi:MAG TPA: FhaA domain-containing protein [Pyrinomonadaceae bacterium]|nr:FhaA domain-containing protein [Pyrinomonadaceae bacterium]